MAQLADVPEGTKTHIRLGMDLDELSRPVELDVTVKHKGRLEGFMGYEGDYGACVLVSVEGYPIDIIVAEASHAVVELHQFEAAGAHCADYGVVIVKQGYIFPELKELGALCVMSLTDGATLQDTRRRPSSASCAPCSRWTIFKKQNESLSKKGLIQYGKAEISLGQCNCRISV